MGILPLHVILPSCGHIPYTHTPTSIHNMLLAQNSCGAAVDDKNMVPLQVLGVMLLAGASEMNKPLPSSSWHFHFPNRQLGGMDQGVLMIMQKLKAFWTYSWTSSLKECSRHS